MPEGSEAAAENAGDVVGAAHGIEMDGRDAVREQVAALADAPLRADFVDCLRAGGVGDGTGQLLRNVDGEGFRQQADLAGRGEGLQAGQDRNGDPGGAATVHEAIEHGVVEKHLRDDVVRSGFDLAAEVFNVCLGIGRFEVLFRIAADADAERRLSLFKLPHGGNQFISVGIAARGRGEAFFAEDRVPTQGEDIVDSKKFIVVQLVADILCGVAGADQVRHDFDREGGHDRGADRDRTDPAADKMAGETSVLLRAILDFVPVAGDIDVPRCKLHESADLGEQFVFAQTIEGRDDFEGGERLSAGFEYVGDFHGIRVSVGKDYFSKCPRNIRARSASMPRAAA